MTDNNVHEDDDPEQDVERVGRPEPSVFEGMHNALISNPDLREAHKEALDEHGRDRARAFEYAYRKVHGDEYWEEEYADRVADELSEEGGETVKSTLPLDEDETADDRGEDPRTDDSHNMTLADWATRIRTAEDWILPDLQLAASLPRRSLRERSEAERGTARSPVECARIASDLAFTSPAMTDELEPISPVEAKEMYLGSRRSRTSRSRSSCRCSRPT